MYVRVITYWMCVVFGTQCIRVCVELTCVTLTVTVDDPAGPWYDMSLPVTTPAEPANDTTTVLSVLGK